MEKNVEKYVGKKQIVNLMKVSYPQKKSEETFNMAGMEVIEENANSITVLHLQ